MKKEKSILFMILINIVALTLLHFDAKYDFLGDLALGVWFLPLLFNIDLLRPYIFKNKQNDLEK